MTTVVFELSMSLEGYVTAPHRGRANGRGRRGIARWAFGDDPATHQAPAESPDGGVDESVTADIHTALARAKALPGERVVVVMGGADLGRQFIQAGPAEVISIHPVPVLLGGGTRLFDDTRLEVTEVVPSPTATHLRFRVPDPQTAHP